MRLHPRGVWAALACFLLALTEAAEAGPPGAMLSRKVQVPDSLRTAPFDTDRYLNIPPGFNVSVWTRLPNPRFLAVAPNGDIFVSQPDYGSITILRPGAGAAIPAAFVYATGLRSPHGLAFDTVASTTWLFVGESNQILRYVWRAGDTTAPTPSVLVTALPDGDGYGHPLKNIAIGPDHSLYVSIGSSCNARAEDTAASPVRAAIYRYNADGSGGELFAQGLRNAEGLAFAPGTNTLWAAVNNRDEIIYPFPDATGNYGTLVRSYVDDHPPELFTQVRQGGNYGWPFCNPNPNSASGFDRMPLDADFETNATNTVDCSTMDRVTRGMQAHSAPLGLTFLQESAFAAPWRNGAVIAFHGSWDRTDPTGYKVVWFPWNELTQMPGTQTDLVTGFLGWGRPVDAVAAADGSLLISDDDSGVIYRMTWKPSAVSAASGYPVIAPGSYATVYGSNLASQTISAASPDYPSELGGVSMIVTDAAGKSSSAPLVFVSPGQINFLVPSDMSSGTGRLTLKTASSTVDLGEPEIRTTAPGLFSANGGGTGPAAAVALDSSGNVLQAPVDVTHGPVYLALFGTGIRGAAQSSVGVTVNGISVPVLYSGAQATFPGLDQINIQLPPSLAGSGTVSIETTVGADTSNAVTLVIR